MKNRRFLLVYILLFVFLISCNRDYRESDYGNLCKSFYTIYFEVVKDIDSNKTSESLEFLQKEENQDKLKILADKLKDNKDKVPQEKIKYYDEMKNKYNKLNEMNEYSKQSWEKLSIEQRRMIFTHLVIMSKDLSEWESDESTRIWW